MPQDRSVDIYALLKKIVRYARTGDYGAASGSLNRALLLVQTELSSGTQSPDNISKLSAILSQLLAAQKRGDWVGFADVMEYTFAKFWRENFTAPC
jgi:hypothetical protein